MALTSRDWYATIFESKVERLLSDITKFLVWESDISASDAVRAECKAVLVPASMCLMWYSEMILGGARKLTDETVEYV